MYQSKEWKQCKKGKKWHFNVSQNKVSEHRSANLSSDLGAKSRGFTIRNNLLKKTLLCLCKHQPLQHPYTLRRHINCRCAPNCYLPRYIIPQKRKRSCRSLKRIACLLQPGSVTPIARQGDLAIHGSQIEKHTGFLKMDVLLSCLLRRLKCVKPCEIKCVDVAPIGRDWEAGLNCREGAEVRLEKVTTSGERIGARRFLEIETKFAQSI